MDSLNTGDVFILDAGLKLFLWSGESANMYEKSKGVQMMQRIKVRRSRAWAPASRDGRLSAIGLSTSPIGVHAGGRACSPFPLPRRPSVDLMSRAGTKVLRDRAGGQEMGGGVCGYLMPPRYGR